MALLEPGDTKHEALLMPRTRHPHRASIAALATALCVALVSLVPARQARPAGDRPRLIVVLAVDQMRGDYVEDYRGQWTGGLRRLVDKGAWFRRAAYPYLNTVTCAGHATIATGALPQTHGVVLNEWWERESQRPVPCTDDRSAAPVSYGAPLKTGHSSARLKVTTLSDQMRAQLAPAPRVVTLSIKPRSAMMLAGHAGDVVLWRQDGIWATSTAFSPGPVAIVSDWLARHPAERDRSREWKRSLPFGRYLHDDTPLGKRPPAGWGPSLPHPLEGDPRLGKKVDLNALWQASPFADEYLGALAEHLVEHMRLGQQSSTDYLGISFSAVDSVGHKFGPASHEVQDALVRLDATIGRLLNALDRAVGPDRYAVALSADHGVSPVPEQLIATGREAGRLKSADVVARLESALRDVLGPGKYVARMFYTDVYFLPGVYDRLRADPRAMSAALEALSSTPGIARVFRSDELERPAPADDGLAHAARLSHYAGRSGDLILVPKLHWIISSDAATHGTAHPYDARVPVAFMGYGISPGAYDGAASPADIAPTLARLAGVRLPDATGRVLAEAVAPEFRGESSGSRHTR